MYMYVESHIMEYEYETSFADSEWEYVVYTITPLHTLAIQNCMGCIYM